MQVKGTGARGAVIGAKSGGAIFQTRMEEVWQWWAVGKKDNSDKCLIYFSLEWPTELS